MKTVTISLNSIDKVKAFVNDITKFDSDFDLVSGRYVIDAKSIMGIFSLDLSKPIDLNIHSEDDVNAILDVLKTPKEDFFEGIALKDDINLLNQYFEVLSEREKDILIRRYGLYENDEHTQKEIAKTLHISRSYVSRIEKRALTKILREFIKNNQID